MTVRKIVLQFHLITGLVSAVVLLLLGLSGSMLVFENEIDHWLNAPLAYVHPGGQRLPLDTLASLLEKAHPGTKLTSLSFPIEDDLAVHAMLRPAAQGKSLMLAVNPYTGSELGSLEHANNLMRNVHQFHSKLLLGENGKLITGCGAVLLFGLSLSGIVLWWPRKLLRFGSGAFQLHNALGFYSSVFMLIFAATGMVIHWDDAAKTFVNKLSRETDPPMPKLTAPPAGATPLSAGRAQAIALTTVPGATVTSIQSLNNLRNPIRITIKFPEDHTPAGRTNVYLDPATGDVLFAQNSRTASLGIRVVKLWNREIHTGDIFGWPTRLLACVASLALPLLAITGPLIWWSRIRKRTR